MDDAARIKHEDILAGDAQRLEEFAAGDGAAVGDDGDQVGARRHLVSGQRIFVDFKRGFGDAGRIS